MSRTKKSLIIGGAVVLLAGGVMAAVMFFKEPSTISLRPTQPLKNKTAQSNTPHTTLAQTTPVAQDTLLITPQQTYQRMIGFGAFMSRFDEPHMLYWQDRGNPKDTVPAAVKEKILDEAYRTLFLDSVTIGVGQRSSPSYDWPSAWEISNDNNDPTTISWNGLRFDRTYWDPLFKNIQGAKSRVEARGGTFTLILKHSWGIDQWMSTKGGALRDGMEEEYAENLTALILWIKDTYNIEATYIAPMNEPDGAGGMSPRQLVSVIKKLGPMLQRYNLKTGILAPEVYLPSGAAGYIEALSADSQASQYVTLVGFHGYDRDLSVGLAGDTRSRERIAAFATQIGADVLQGEYSACCKNERTIKTFWANTFDQGLAWAQDAHTDITSANAGGFDMQLSFWQSGDPSAYVLLQFDANKNYIGYSRAKFYYPLAQYINYVRPGMRRIDVRSGNKNILATGYVNEQTKQAVLVVINTSKQQQSMKLAFSGVSTNTMQGTRSSRTENMQSIPAISLTQGVVQSTFAAESVTTFVGGLSP